MTIHIIDISGQLPDGGAAFMVYNSVHSDFFVLDGAQHFGSLDELRAIALITATRQPAGVFDVDEFISRVKPQVEAWEKSRGVYLSPDAVSALQPLLDWDMLVTGELPVESWVRYDKLDIGEQAAFLRVLGRTDVKLRDADLPESAVKTLRLVIAPHQFYDDWDTYDDGIPGKCGFPLCTERADSSVHLPADPHAYEEHPQLAGTCRTCGLLEVACVATTQEAARGSAARGRAVG